MKNALNEFVIEGFKTTIPFHKKIMEDECFLKGDIHVNFIEERIGKPVNPGLLYPFLKQLEKNRLVTLTKKPVGQKPKNVYELTSTGKELAARIYKRIASMVSLAIEPNLRICFHCGCKIYEGGYREAISDRERIFCCVHCAQAYKSESSSSA